MKVLLSLFVVLIFTSVSVSSAQDFGQLFRGPRPMPQRAVIKVDDASIDRVRAWLEAIGDHLPGASDMSATTVASWSTSEMQTLWINATVLLQLMHSLTSSTFSGASLGGLSFGKGDKSPQFTIKGESRVWEIQYSPAQIRRLKVFACVAAGLVLCPETKPGETPEHLGRLAEQVAAARRGGDRNFALRRGALLHADIGMTDRPSTRPVGSGALPGPQQMRIHIFDGREAEQDEVAIHWVIGRLLLDAVTPAHATKPAPGGDEMVRLWYRATAAWMQNHEYYDTLHLAHARALFPVDPDILFLSGCQREVLASPRLHAALEGAVIPRGFSIDVGSVGAELRRAEGFFRRAIEAKADMVEAHLHLGHVLLLRKDYQDAADHLRRAAPLGRMDDEVLEYSRSLFLGAAEEMLGQNEAARAAFERASALQPSAQSPLLALSELARRRGDRGTALNELHRVFALPSSDTERDDPWWAYYVVQARNEHELLDRLREPF